MPDFTVRGCGTDTSGRPIYMTVYMADWWEQVHTDLGFAPTIVQGAFMARIPGGGAAASAGYHDAAGCLDLRTWDLTEAQVEQVIRTTRRHGAASWVRDERHGMDPHIHLVLGADSPLADGAAWQWEQYLAGRDGLSSGGRDYHWRPDPIVTEPPEDDMTQYADQLDRIERQNDAILKRLAAQGAIRVRLAKLVEQGKADSKDLAALQRELGVLTDGA